MSNALPTTTAVTLANSTSAILDLNGNSQTIGSLAGGNGKVTLGSGTLTVGDATSTLYTGVISGTLGNLVKQGWHADPHRQQHLHRHDDRHAGTLQLGNNTAVRRPRGKYVDNADVVFFNSTGSIKTYAGAISGTGNVTQKGNSLLTLTGTNSYTGNTTVNAGTLVTARDCLVARLQFVRQSRGGQRRRGRRLGGTGWTEANFDTLRTNANWTAGRPWRSTPPTATIPMPAYRRRRKRRDGFIGLTKVGVNTLTLTGANTYSGTTTVTAGTLSYGANDVIASGAVSVISGTINLGNFSDTVGAVTFNATSGTTTTPITGAGTLTSTSGFTTGGYGGIVWINACLAGNVGLTTSGNASVYLTCANVYTGATVINDGWLYLSGGTIACQRPPRSQQRTFSPQSWR